VPELILVRHAPTSWSGRCFCGRGDPPLNRAGHAVARRLAADLASALPLAGRIVSSPARRARQTADAIARAIPGALVQLDDRWSEADFGIAEGLTFDELVRVAPDLAARLGRGEVTIDWPGGEAASELAERVAAAWRDLIEQPTSTIIVSHAGPLRMAIALATNQPVEGVALPEPGAVVRLADLSRT
jgi:broad specificity phosphatase PhoE